MTRARQNLDPNPKARRAALTTLACAALALGCGRYAPPIRPEAPAPATPPGWDAAPTQAEPQPEPPGWDLEATPGSELPDEGEGETPAP